MNKQVEFSPEQYAVLQEAVQGAIKQTRAERVQPVPDNLFTGCNVYITSNKPSATVETVPEQPVPDTDSQYIIDIRSLPQRKELLTFIIAFIERISTFQKSSEARRLDLERDFAVVQQLAKGDTSTDLIKGGFGKFVATLYGLESSLGALTDFEETNGKN